jgi:hypothetical protein
MKLTKEALKQIIKEELEGVLETSRGRFGQKQNRSRIVTKDRQPPTSTMDLQTAIAFLKFGWGELEDDQKQKIEDLKATLKRRSENPRGYGASPETATAEYNKLAAAIKKAKPPEVEEGMLGKVRDAIMGPETPEDKKAATKRQQRRNTRRTQAPASSMKLRGPFEEDKK